MSERVKVIHSERTDCVHREGVALMLNKAVQKTYFEHKPVSSRIISVILRGQHRNGLVIQVYVDMLLIRGDSNSNIGNTDNGYQELMGKHT